MMKRPISMTLAVIAGLYGDEAARGIADGMEYLWSRDPDNDPLAVGDTG